jgi:transposase
MDTVIRTLRLNLRGICAACSSTYSNGPVEGINRKIKELKRSCYGFANQEKMFDRVYQIIA